MDLTDVTGRFGPWQRRILCVMMYRAMPAAFILLNVQFFLPEMDHWCARGEHFNVSVEEWRSFGVPPNSRCEKYPFDPEGVSTNVSVKCDEWEFEPSKYGPNIKEEWSLVCDRSWLTSLCFTMITFGNFISFLPAGHLSDKYGRKRVSLIGMTSLLVFGVAGCFAQSIEVFLALRLLTGITYGFFQTAALCLFLEAVGPEYRLLMSLAFLGTWGLGIMILPGVALLVNNWRILQLVTFVPLNLISPILIWRFVPESARWLLTVGKKEEAKKIICQGAKMNGVEILDADNVIEELLKKIKEEEMSHSTAKNATFFDLFRTKKIRRMTLILYTSSLLTVFIYYGFTLTAGDLGGSLHINTFYIGLSSSIGCGIFLLETKYMSRRKSLLMNFALCGLSFFISLGIPDELTWLRLTIVMFGQGCNGIAYALLWMFSAEIFPTNLRTVGVSGGMSAGSIGSILSTFMNQVGRLAGKKVPIAIFGTLAIVNSVLFLLLPETRDKHLPDTLKESERLPEKVAYERVDTKV